MAGGEPGPLDALHDGAQAARRHNQRPCMGSRGVHKMYNEFAHPNIARKTRNECQLHLETSLIRGWLEKRGIQTRSFATLTSSVGLILVRPVALFPSTCTSGDRLGLEVREVVAEDVEGLAEDEVHVVPVGGERWAEGGRRGRGPEEVIPRTKKKRPFEADTQTGHSRFSQSRHPKTFT